MILTTGAGRRASEGTRDAGRLLSCPLGFGPSETGPSVIRSLETTVARAIISAVGALQPPITTPAHEHAPAGRANSRNIAAIEPKRCRITAASLSFANWQIRPASGTSWLDAIAIDVCSKPVINGVVAIQNSRIGGRQTRHFATRSEERSQDIQSFTLRQSIRMASFRVRDRRSASVRRWPFYMIDDQRISRSLTRFHCESELILQGGNDHASICSAAAQRIIALSPAIGHLDFRAA